MTNKEKKFQKALGLEKGFIAQIPIKICVEVSLPVIVKDLSADDAFNKLDNLSDTAKKRIIKHICKALMAGEWMDRKELGEDVVEIVKSISKRHLTDIDPKDLAIYGSEISPVENIDTTDDAIEYLKTDCGLTEEEILII